MVTDGDVSQVLDRFGVAQQARGLTPATIRHRRYQLARFLAGVEDPWAVTHRDVEGYVAARRLGPSALSRALSDVAVFYRWARRDGLTDADPVELLDRPRQRRAVPRPLPDGVVLRALGHRDHRTAAAVALMAYGGLRCCEVARARWGDVDWTAAAVYVTGKGGHTRWVPVVPPMAPYLARLDGLEPADPILPRGDLLPGPASPARVSQRIGGWLRVCSAGQRATAHQLRHWYATQVLARTGRLETVQLLLGHRSISTTEVYAAIPAAWGEHLRDVWPD